MIPFGYLSSWTFDEHPNRTHFWNNRALTPNELKRLSPKKMVRVAGIPGEYVPKLIDIVFPISHIPVCGGWTHYVVLRPECTPKTWHVCWVTGDDTKGGVSKVAIHGNVRMLIGASDVKFSGIENGRQINLHLVSRGKIGFGGPWKKNLML